MERRPRTHVSSRAQPNEPSAFFARALLSFLDCIFVPYQIFYFIERSLGSLRSFLPVSLAFPLPSFRFAVDYTREDTSLPFCGNLSTLSSSISLLAPQLLISSARNAYLSFLTTCLSSATSFYSAFRISNVIIHPSAKLLRESQIFVVEYFRLGARARISFFFFFCLSTFGVTWELHVLLLAREPESWNDDGVVTMTEGGRKINESEERIFSVFSKEVETVF